MLSFTSEKQEKGSSALFGGSLFYYPSTLTADDAAERIRAPEALKAFFSAIKREVFSGAGRWRVGRSQYLLVERIAQRMKHGECRIAIGERHRPPDKT